MNPAQRQDLIVQLVERLGEVQVDALAAKYGNSRETIRRDLNALDAAGRVRKFRGAACRGTPRPDTDRGAV